MNNEVGVSVKSDELTPTQEFLLQVFNAGDACIKTLFGGGVVALTFDLLKGMPMNESLVGARGLIDVLGMVGYGFIFLYEASSLIDKLEN